MTYGYFKDLTRRTTSDNILCDTALNIAKNSKYDGYQRRLASVVYSFFDKKNSGSGIKNVNASNEGWARALHKAIIRKFNKRNVHSSFLNNTWDANLADIQLISKFNKGINDFSKKSERI